MCDNLISFVDGYIFQKPSHGAFALAHRGLGIIPELTKTLWDLLDLHTLFCAHLVLITSVVLLFDGSGFFQLTQLGIPLRF